MTAIIRALRKPKTDHRAVQPGKISAHCKKGGRNCHWCAVASCDCACHKEPKK